MFKCRILRAQLYQGTICLVVIRLVVTGKWIAELWYVNVRSGGGFACAPKIRRSYIV